LITVDLIGFPNLNSFENYIINIFNMFPKIIAKLRQKNMLTGFEEI